MSYEEGSKETTNKNSHINSNRTENNDREILSKTHIESSPTKKDENFRLKYYSNLKGRVDNMSKSFLAPSRYYLEENLFPIANVLDLLQRKDEPQETAKKTSSLMTIFSIWNTMIGSGIVSIPWATKQAGLIPAFFIVFIYGVICFYTAWVYVKTGIHDKDFSDTVAKYFGKKYGFIGRSIQIVASMMLNLGACFIFFLIIKYVYLFSQNFFPVVAFIVNSFGGEIDYDKGGIPDFSEFSIVYTAIILLVLLFPFLIREKVGLLIKINSFGIYFVSILIFFVFFVGFKSLFTTTFDFQLVQNHKESDVRHLYLFGDNPFKLAGTLSLGFISHTYIVPVIKNNAEPKNNRRDLLVGYILVGLTYLLMGVIGYIGFSGKGFEGEFYDNWFKFYEPNNILIFVLRIFSVLQLFTIYPIIAYVIRINFFGTFFGNPYPSRLHIIAYASLLLGCSMIVLYFFYNSLGNLMGIIGAAFGFILVYIIPIVINIIYYRRKHPPKKVLLDHENLNSDDEISQEQEELQIDGKENRKESLDLKDQFIFTGKKRNYVKDCCFYITMYIIIALGLITLVFQFVYVNIFNIQIRSA